MSINRYREDILHIMHQEGISLEDLKKKPQDDTIQKVSKAVFDKLVQNFDLGYSTLKPNLSTASPKVVSDFFKNCLLIMQGEKPERLLIEFAKVCAEQDPKGTVYHITDFDITDSKVRAQIAKICAQREASVTAQFIKHFNITDEDDLIEIVKLCAEQDLESTAYYINNFKIIKKGQKVLVDIAKRCVEECTFTIVTDIIKFDITNEDDLIKITKLCAEKDAAKTAKFIKNFKIKNQKALIEIAKLCAEKDAAKTALFIENFKIEDPTALFEIASICAMHEAAETAFLIRNFGINDQELLIKIANLCAQQNGWDTLLSIKNFNITDPKALIEIANLCLQQSGHDITLNIQNEGISEKEVLFEIFRLCALEGGVSTAQSIQKLGITDSSVLDMVCAYCLLKATNFFKDTVEATEFFSNPHDEIPKKISDLYKRALSADFIESTVHELGESWNFISKYTGNAINRELLISLFFVCKATNKTNTLTYEYIPELIEVLLNYRAPFLKTRLLQSLLNVIAYQTQNQFINSYKSKLPGKQQNKAPALMFFLTIFTMNNLNHNLKTIIVENYLKALKKRNSFLPQASKTGSLIEFIHILNNSIPQEQEKICELFLSYQNKDEFSKKIFVFQAASGLGIDIRRKNFEEVKNLVWKQLELPDGFEKIFENLRRNECLIPYITRIHKLSETKKSDVEKSLAMYLQEVADGTIVENRYAQSPQLKNLQKLYDPVQGRSLIEKWKQLNVINIEEFLTSPNEFTGYTVENTDNHWDLFLCGTEVAGSCQRVDGDPDTNKALLGYILDGKIRMIAVKETTGRIAARSIIKLLWDDKQKKPVLFVEPVYSNNAKLNPVILQMAKKEAERLGVRLVTSESASGLEGLLQSFANRSGIEYEDAEYMIEKIPPIEA